MSNKEALRTFSTVPEKAETENRVCPLCATHYYRKFCQLQNSIFVRCKKCGMIIQDPQPILKSVVSRYSDPSYLEYEKNNHLAYRKIAMKSLCEAGLDISNSKDENGNTKSVIEIGCATGALLSLFKQNAWNTYGVEVSTVMSDFAKKEFGLEVFNGTLENANISDSSYDIVLATHLIEHLNNPKLFLENTYRILKNKSYMYLITPNSASFQALIKKDKWRSIIEDHLYLFSKSNLSRMLQQVGFKIDYVGTWGGWPSGMKPLFLKKPIDSLAKMFGVGDVMVVRAYKSESESE